MCVVLVSIYGSVAAIGDAVVVSVMRLMPPTTLYNIIWQELECNEHNSII